MPRQDPSHNSLGASRLVGWTGVGRHRSTEQRQGLWHRTGSMLGFKRIMRQPPCHAVHLACPEANSQRDARSSLQQMLCKPHRLWAGKLDLQVTGCVSTSAKSARRFLQRAAFGPCRSLSSCELSRREYHFIAMKFAAREMSPAQSMAREA